MSCDGRISDSSIDSSLSDSRNATAVDKSLLLEPFVFVETDNSVLSTPDTDHCSLEGGDNCESLSAIIPPEPDPGTPHSVILSIKLPNCERIQRRFNYRTDKIMSVLHFAHSILKKEGNNSFNVDDAFLSDNNVPMNVYFDGSLTLIQAGLTHNTVLHFSYK